MASYYIDEEDKDSCYYLMFRASHDKDILPYLTVDIRVDKSIMKECGINVYRKIVDDLIQNDVRRERNRG